MIFCFSESALHQYYMCAPAQEGDFYLFILFFPHSFFLSFFLFSCLFLLGVRTTAESTVMLTTNNKKVESVSLCFRGWERFARAWGERENNEQLTERTARLQSDTRVTEQVGAHNKEIHLRNGGAVIALKLINKQVAASATATVTGNQSD